MHFRFIIKSNGKFRVLLPPVGNESIFCLLLVLRRKKTFVLCTCNIE